MPTTGQGLPGSCGDLMKLDAYYWDKHLEAIVLRSAVEAHDYLRDNGASPQLPASRL